MNIIDFLNTSYTSYHTVHGLSIMLEQAGYTRLSMGKPWKLQQGGTYYVTRNMSSLIAFKVGKNKVFSICESHTDSPCFKIKGDKLLTNDNALRLNTEKYGGAILYSYFDRPLKVAGRLLVNGKDCIEQIIVNSHYNVVIPSVAIHLNRGVNEGFAPNLQIDCLPLFAQGDNKLYESLTDRKVIDGDLYVAPAMDAFYAGVDNEFLCSARLDNLTSVYTSVVALIESKVNNIAMAVCLDNEEVGSGTRQGSPNFVAEVIDCICDALEMTHNEKLYALRKGLALSVDNAHACHPAHPEKSDVTNKAYLNKGIAIKHHTNYATDGVSASVFKNILNEAKIPYQDLYNRSDGTCGSTLGLVTARTLGMKVCDIGIAQLAMHSACETCGTDDIATMQRGILAFFHTPTDKLNIINT